MTDPIQQEEQAFLDTKVMYWNERPIHVMCHKNGSEYAVSLLGKGIGFTGRTKLEAMDRIRKYLSDKKA